MPPLAKGRLVSRLLIALLLLTAASAHAQSLYWIDTNFGSPRLGWAQADGTGPVYAKLPTGSQPEGLALDAAGNKVYWTESDWTGSRVMRASATLGSATTLVTGGSCMHGIALDLVHGMMYWTASNLTIGGQVWSAHLDGTGAAPILNLGSSSNPHGIAVDPIAGVVYFTDFDEPAIFFCALNGTGLSAISAPVGLWGIAYDASSLGVIVSDYVAGQIRRYTFSPPTVTTLVSGLLNPTYVTLDPPNGKMYWSEPGAAPYRTARANLNGTSIQYLNLPIANYGGLGVGVTNVAGVDPGPGSAGATAFALAPVAPNPAGERALIAYTLPRDARVRLTVVDLQGREIARLIEGDQTAGTHEVAWMTRHGADRTPPGLYFIRYETPGRTLSRRVAVTR